MLDGMVDELTRNATAAVLRIDIDAPDIAELTMCRQHNLGEWGDVELAGRRSYGLPINDSEEYPKLPVLSGPMNVVEDSAYCTRLNVLRRHSVTCPQCEIMLGQDQVV